MSYELKTRKVDGRLHMHLSGTLDLAAGQEIAGTVRKACEEEGCDKLLADIRDADVELSLTERFRLGVVVAAQVFEMNMPLKIAGVVAPGAVRSDKFFETVVANRGIRFRTFTDLDNGMQWLTE